MRRSGTTTPVREILVIVGAFAVAGMVAAVAWHQIVHLPSYVRTGAGGAMEATDLAARIDIDAWYAVIAAVGALLVTLGLWRLPTVDHRLRVVSISLAATLAGWLMQRLGHLFGPGDVEARLAAAQEGQRVVAELTPESAWILLVWPIVAVFVWMQVLVWGRGPALLRRPRSGAHHDSVAEVTQSRGAPGGPR